MIVTETLISFTALPSLLAACLVLLGGNALCQRIGFLARYSIPSPVVGGLLFAVAAAMLLRTTGKAIALSSGARSDLLLLFFACLGLTADLRLLASAGPRLLRFLLALAPALLVQDLLGVLVAKSMGMHPFLGLVAGSITLAGGHGTGVAYVGRFGETSGIPGIMELAMISATLGLVFGGVIGGPVAERLIGRGRLVGVDMAGEGGVITGPAQAGVTMMPLIASLAAGLVAVIAGRAAATALVGAPVTVPDFLLCLLAGLLLRNLGVPCGLRLDDAATDLIGAVCLSLFLAWTMMALDLGAVVNSAAPLLLILACQVVLVAVWASLVVFRLVGRDYEGAVMSAAFCGFGLGATATAIANMQAIARRHGPAPQAFLIVPIVGAFFVDILNALVLTLFLSLPFMGLR
jgi:ESS family glutamate:Na+ symporter